MRRFIKLNRLLSVFLALVLISCTFIPVHALALEGGKAFNLFHYGIKTISIRNGNTGHVIYLDDEENIQKVVDCLNAFRYSSKSAEADSVGYQYLIQMELREGNIDGTTLSYPFTANSIVVDGERLISTEKSPLSTLIGFLPEKPILLFDDVSSDDRCYNDVKYVVEKGIFSGVSPSHFDPDASLNRGMAVTILHRLAGCPNPSQKAVFQDIEPESWYANAVYWAAGNQIVSGTGDETFQPNGLVTREQLAVMMYKYAQQECYANAMGDLSRYTDGADVSSWAKEAMEWAVRAGIMDCKTDIVTKANSVLDPQGTVSRADACGMMRNLSEYVAYGQRVV